MTSVHPAEFLLTTDFPTLKNDASVVGFINIGGALSIGTGGVNASSDFTVGTKGAVTRTRWASSVDNFTYYNGQYHIYNRVGTASGSPASYNIGVFVLRIDPNTLRMQLFIPNPYGVTLTGAAAEQIAMYSETFITPYT